MLAFQLLLVAVVLYAFMRGGRDERLVSVLFAAAYLATLVVNMVAADNYMRPQWPLFALDVLVAAALTVLAKSGRRWLVWMLALQLIAVIEHVARWMSPGIMNWIYYALTAMLGYPMLGLLAVATWRESRRRMVGARRLSG